MTQETTKRRITLERRFEASVADVWELWTTKDGIEAWWGPEGFTVKVHQIDVRPGGELLYAMTATGPDQIAFMKQAEMPLTTESRAVYDEVVAHRKLGFTMLADFIPGVEPYPVSTSIEFHESAEGVRTVLQFDAMHDAHWTEMQTMGYESELDRLEALLAARR